MVCPSEAGGWGNGVDECRDGWPCREKIKHVEAGQSHTQPEVAQQQLEAVTRYAANSDFLSKRTKDTNRATASAYHVCCCGFGFGIITVATDGQVAMGGVVDVEEAWCRCRLPARWCSCVAMGPSARGLSVAARS